MSDTIRGSVDFIEPEFLHALGIAVATFARLEAALTNAYFAAEHGTRDYADFPASAMKIYEADFSTRIDLTFKAIRKKVRGFKRRGFEDLQAEFHEARIARNFVVHGAWLTGTSVGSYVCSMMDAAGRRVKHEVNAAILLGEAQRADHLLIQLKTLLVSEELYPAVGPTISSNPAQD